MLRNPERAAGLLAVLIGFASLLSAAIAWRASLASIDYARYESLLVQEQARTEQLEQQLEGVVAQDQRFVNAYQEDSVAARQLQAQADSLRDSDPVAADQLDLEAQARLALGRALEPFFQGANVTLNSDGTVEYEHDYVLRNLEEGNVELRELRSEDTAELAHHADVRTLSLIGVAAIIVAALFFLTIAQVSRARGRLRRAFFVAGGALVAVGTVSFIVVELVA